MLRILVCGLLLLSAAPFCAGARAAELEETAALTPSDAAEQETVASLGAIEAAAAHAEASFAADDPRRLAALAALARAYRRAGEFVEAESVYQTIIDQERAQLPQSHAALAPLLAYMATTTHPAALDLIRESLVTAMAGDPPTLSRVLEHLSAIADARTDFDGNIAAIFAVIGEPDADEAADGTDGDAKYVVQFAALRNPSREAHQEYLDGIKRNFGALLNGYPLKVLPPKNGSNSDFHRMVAGPMPEGAGREICRALAERHQDCMVVLP